ncbi:MAG TPA: fluoride efflux transporter CrcB [Gemmatimonadales bacterium]|nr:fluoride efflux transporter CrcB [Gemmatimonadales bacterium]
MKLIWYVAAGGAIGSVARLLLSALIQAKSGTALPVGTLVVNITGSLLLGFLIQYLLATPGTSPEIRAFLTTGLCGGYTTFSTFSFETATLVQDGDYRRAALYIILSVSVSLLATFAGFALARELITLREGL